MRAALLLAACTAALAACGPVSVQQAERECFHRARVAQQPRGEVWVGADSTGKKAGGFSLEISSDYIQGRDPSAVYDACVYQKSGQPPSRPLYSRPDWKA